MTDSPGRVEILIVDDSKVIRRAASKVLSVEYLVHEAENGLEAWDILEKEQGIAVVFSDLQMPELDGFGLLKKIRESDDAAISALPVIILTGREDDEGAKEEVLSHGATDFISKPFDSIDLKSRASSYAKYNARVNELEKRVSYDKLTGLYSETSFLSQGSKALSFANRHNMTITVACFEVLHLVDFYQKSGKDKAQDLLVSIAGIISDNLRKEDIAARMGVSTMALLLPLTNKAEALMVIQRITEAVCKKVIAGVDAHAGLGFVGAFLTPALSADVEIAVLLKQAQQALQEAISKGTGSIVHYGADTGVAEAAEANTSKANSTDAGEKPQQAVQVGAQGIDIHGLIEAISERSHARLNKDEILAVLRHMRPFFEHADRLVGSRLSRAITGIGKNDEPT